jgi:hypothetical protein
MIQKPINPNDFPVGISDFKKIIKEKCILIDKTLFIKDIMENKATVILITRPRRFGKTLAMSMLSHFLKIGGEEGLFEGLNIKDHEEFCTTHQNKYPVIFLTFKDVKYDDFATAYSDIKGIFSDLYSKNRDLCEGDLLSLEEKAIFQKILSETLDDPAKLGYALKKMTEFMHRKYGVPPIVLLDEYDTPIVQGYVKGYYAQMISFMRSLLGSALKDNSDLGKAVITGITKVSQESLFSGLKNLDVYTVLDKGYGQYFGFTEDEVSSLLPEGSSIEPIKAWYNGYRIGKYQLYNPWSIMKCLRNEQELMPYWVGTSDNAFVYELIEKHQIYAGDRFENLIRGIPEEQVLKSNLSFPDLDTQEDSIWTLLIHTGYLHVTASHLDEDGQMIGILGVPNKEVRCVYKEMVTRWFTPLAFNSNYYGKMMKTLLDGNVEKFTDHIRTYINGSVSFFDLHQNTPENVFHAFMLGLFMGLGSAYHVDSNKEAGKGRYDIIIIPKDKTKMGILMEFKIAQTPETLMESAKDALAQIQTKNYTNAFTQHDIKNVLLIGMAFCGREVESVMAASSRD